MSAKTMAPSVASAAADEQTENTLSNAVPDTSATGGLPRRWLRAREAAAYLGICYHRLGVLREQGRGPQYRKFGRMVIYDVRDIDAYMEALPARGGR